MIILERVRYTLKGGAINTDTRSSGKMVRFARRMTVK